MAWLLGFLFQLWFAIKARPAPPPVPPRPAAAPELKPEPSLWYPGCSAFWLDPDLWYGVEDPHRDMCWMHLDERPKRAVRREPHLALSISHADFARLRGDIRERALDILAEANNYEDRGFTSMAAMLRDRAATNLRNLVVMEKSR